MAGRQDGTAGNGGPLAEEAPLVSLKVTSDSLEETLRRVPEGPVRLALDLAHRRMAEADVTRAMHLLMCWLRAHPEARLSALSLAATGLSDAGAAHVSALATGTALDLRHNGLTTQGLASLALAITHRHPTPRDDRGGGVPSATIVDLEGNAIDLPVALLVLEGLRARGGLPAVCTDPGCAAGGGPRCPAPVHLMGLHRQQPPASPCGGGGPGVERDMGDDEEAIVFQPIPGAW